MSCIMFMYFLYMELGILRIGYRCKESKKKLESWGYLAEKKFDDVFSRLDTIHQRDGRTDRHRATTKTALTHSVAR